MSEERNYEAEAREQGWVDQEEYRDKHGHVKGWKEAQAFVEVGESILPIVNAKNKKLEAEVHQLRSRVEEVMQASEEFKNYTVVQSKKAKAERDQLIRDLEKAQSEAVTAGDGEAFQRTQQQLNKIRSASEDRPDDNPEIEKIKANMRAWEQEHAWYNGNTVAEKKMTAAVDGVSKQVAAEKPWLQGTGAPFYEACLEAAQEMYPESFEKTNGANKVEDGGQRHRSSSKARTFENLPDDAKTAFKRFEKNFGMTQEEYLATYEWE